MNKEQLQQKLQQLNEQIDEANNFIRRCLKIYYSRAEYDPDLHLYFPDEKIRLGAWASAENFIKMRAVYVNKAEHIKQQLAQSEGKENF